MITFIIFVTSVTALKVLYMLIKFGNDGYPDKATIKKDDAAILLGFRLLVFIWGFTLLMR